MTLPIPTDASSRRSPSSSPRSRSGPSGTTSRSGTDSAASRFATATSVELSRAPDSRSRATSPRSSRRWRRFRAPRVVLDGEIVVPVGDALSFDDLLQRIHPAESRVRKLAAETPALYLVFDLLVDEKGRSLVERPLARASRRRSSEFAARHFAAAQGRIRLSPASTTIRAARSGGSPPRAAGSTASSPSAPTSSTARATAPGCRRSSCSAPPTASSAVSDTRRRKRIVGSLLLGLYDRRRRPRPRRLLLGDRRRPSGARSRRSSKRSCEPPGFTGRAPGGPSRWSTERTGEWEPLQPKLVVEVRYDHFSQGRFRHGTRLLRFRPDKAPAPVHARPGRRARAEPRSADGAPRSLAQDRARTACRIWLPV